jgi:hypothetical protein
VIFLGNSGSDTSNTGAATEYVPLTNVGGSTVFNGTQSTTQTVVPRAGTARNLFVVMSSALGSSGDSVQFTLMNGTTATSITCTFNSANNGSGQTSSTACSSASTASFAAGDLISLRVVTANTPSARTFSWGLEYTP